MPAILGLLLLASPVSRAQIFEILEMRAIERAIEPGTLVVFDIDNTLIEPTQMLGSDQWFYALADQIAKDEKLDQKQALDRAMAIWNAVQADIGVRAVERDTPALIRELAERGVPILALTARTFDIAGVTARQLRSVGIALARAPLAKNLELRMASPAKLIDGIMYVGEHNAKGEVLVELLRRTELRPKRIVFIDDKEHHVTSVADALSAAGIPFVAFRYGGADATVRAFRKDVADVEYRRWKKRAE